MWYFVQNSTQKGPVSLEEIRDLINRGDIHSATLVWTQGMDGWVAILETELKDLFPEDMPPPIPTDIPPPIPTRRSGSTATNQKLLEPGRLLRDSFSYVGTVYIPMLTFFVPSLFINILLGLALLENSPGVWVLLSVIYWVCVLPFVSGASIFYVQQNLTQQGVTIADSMQKAGEKFVQLVLAQFILLLILIAAFICLIIPGVYLSLRLSFVYYAVMIENRPATDAISRSWNLTKGFWWGIFWAFFILGLVVGLPAGILGAVFASTNPLISQLVGGIVGLFSGPIIATYAVFLFMSLVNLIGENRENRRYV
ncbi:GYF domain-containing protein [Mastigocoleus sp. MO_188.B34]|uniref:DUF4339 domain-containing protein n=1 Tax=Mastigocoleus sp. MO_188.B34 TaxID=3036635 RepID=UPI00260B68F7|nr:GYF domain-containing protein [Mastigocoleus sp. MO_188.B34]MDJ0697515.1 GYF domain-containing protein [Mastigocoleus sp. MO_188.B34]